MAELAAASTEEEFHEKLKAFSEKSPLSKGSTQEVESPFQKNEDDCYNIDLATLSQFD